METNNYLETETPSIKITTIVKTNNNYFVESRVVETREFEEAYKEFYKPFKIGNKYILCFS